MASKMRAHLNYGFLAAITSFMPLAAWAQPSDRPGWGYGWDMGWGWGHMLSGGLMMLLFWGGIILVIVFAVRAISGGSPQGAPPAASRNKALEILQERFARGEIDKDDFEERKRLLSD